ncbi:MAG: hypothetical protein ACREMB_13600 [Candidatus Rokuibacteriota bacterium]
MQKVVFAAIVLVVGLTLHGLLRRHADRLSPGVRAVVPRAVLALAVGVPVLIQQQYLARWDGRLPQYSLGGANVVPLLQLPGAAGDGGRR